jgi:hypothetical protein
VGKMIDLAIPLVMKALQFRGVSTPLGLVPHCGAPAVGGGSDRGGSPTRGVADTIRRNSTCITLDRAMAWLDEAMGAKDQETSTKLVRELGAQ